MLRVLVVLLVFYGTAHSEEGGPGESKGKAEAAQTDNQHGSPPQQITVPANSAAPTIININTGKHSGEESHCTQPKDWKEWGSFAWCCILEWIDAERIIAIWTVILGIATCILGIATWKLWRSTDALVLGAEETARRQLRAYVFLDGITLRRLDISDKTQWNIQIAWKNTGGTRTRRLIAKVSHDVLDLSQQPLETFDFHDETDAQTFHGLIGPSQSVNPPPIPICDIHLMGASGDDMAFLIWGWAEYQDVFSATIRRTEFGFRMWIDGDISGKCIIRFEPTQRHNAADDDCMKPPTSA